MEERKIDPIKKLATQLKTNSYYDALDIIRKDLELNPSVSYSELEALLIQRINKEYENTIKADTTLMSLSLLTGKFDNRKQKLEQEEEKGKYSERRELLLLETDYICKKTEGRFRTYRDAELAIKITKSDKKTNELATIRSTLDSATTNSIASILKSIYKEKERIRDVLDSAKREYESFASKRNVNQIDWKNCDHIPNAGLPSLCYLKLLSQTDQPEEIADHPEEGDGCSTGSEDEIPEIQSASQEKREELPEQDASLPLKPRQQPSVKDNNGLSSGEDHHPNPHPPQKRTYNKKHTIVIRIVSEVLNYIMIILIVFMFLNAVITIYGIRSARENGGEFNNNGPFFATNYTSKGKIIDDLSSIPPVEILTPNNTEINGQEITRDHMGLIENEVSK